MTSIYSYYYDIAGVSGEGRLFSTSRAPSQAKTWWKFRSNFPKLSNLDCMNYDESHAKCRKQCLNVSKVHSYRKLWQKLVQILKTFGKIFDRNINLGNFAAVKILGELSKRQKFVGNLNTCKKHLTKAQKFTSPDILSLFSQFIRHWRNRILSVRSTETVAWRNKAQCK